MRALVLAVVLGLAASATPAAAQSPPASQERIVDLQRSTPVREFDGRLLFSRWDGSAFRLSLRENGQVRDLAVPSQARPFDADIGPDSRGAPSAVVSLCAASCDLFVIGFSPGDALRPVRNANTSGDDEIAPTVWRGRLAFARRYDADTVIPYTKRLAAPRSRPSQRLAGLPEERCGAVDPPDCRPIENVAVPQLELWGRWVAQSFTYTAEGLGGFRQNEIRLTDVDRTDTRQIAAMTTGLGGQTYHGPAVVNGRVAFFRACLGDQGGCNRSSSGALRYRISSGGYDIAGANEAWSAWTFDGSAAFRVPSRSDCGGDEGNASGEACGIYRQRGLSFSAIAANRVR
jgi:hypothetical protein